jgi:hypothetical protein
LSDVQNVAVGARFCVISRPPLSSIRLKLPAPWEIFRMPIIRRSAIPEIDPQTKQTKEFEYWRTAAELVERMREAGFDCDLWIGSKNRH